MKKGFYLLGVALCCLSLSACSDSDDSAPVGVGQNPLTGGEMVSESFAVEGVPQYDATEGQWTLVTDRETLPSNIFTIGPCTGNVIVISTAPDNVSLDAMAKANRKATFTGSLYRVDHQWVTPGVADIFYYRMDVRAVQ